MTKCSASSWSHWYYERPDWTFMGLFKWDGAIFEWNKIISSYMKYKLRLLTPSPTLHILLPYHHSQSLVPHAAICTWHAMVWCWVSDFGLGLLTYMSCWNCALMFKSMFSTVLGDRGRGIYSRLSFNSRWNQSILGVWVLTGLICWARKKIYVFFDLVKSSGDLWIVSLHWNLKTKRTTLRLGETGRWISLPYLPPKFHRESPENSVKGHDAQSETSPRGRELSVPTPHQQQPALLRRYPDQGEQTRHAPSCLKYLKSAQP